MIVDRKVVHRPELRSQRDKLARGPALAGGWIVLTRNLRDFDLFDQLLPAERVLFMSRHCRAGPSATPFNAPIRARPVYRGQPEVAVCAGGRR
jgi:hypothetical protein